MRRETKKQNAISFPEKVHKMNQWQHTEATTIDFRSGRTRRREAKSSVFPKTEGKPVQVEKL